MKANSPAARSDCRQLDGQRESHIFSNQIEITLIREAQTGQAFAHLLHEHFRRGCSCGHSDTANVFDPFRLNHRGIVNQARGNTGSLGNFHKAIRIRAVGRTHYENQIHIPGHLLHGFLPVLGRIANVVGRRSLDGGKSLAQARDDFLRVVEAQRGLPSGTPSGWDRSLPGGSLPRRCPPQWSVPALRQMCRRSPGGPCVRSR